MSETMRAALLCIPILFIALPAPAQQPAPTPSAESKARTTALPECTWKTKTQWASGEAQLVKPAGSSVGPIVADVIVRFDARKSLDDPAAGRDVVLKLSRPHAGNAIAPTMPFPKSNIRLVIDGVETLRFAADSEGERPIGEAFKNGVTRAGTLEAFASAAAADKPVPLIRCTLTQSAEAIREMEAAARSFAIKQKFEQLRNERARKDSALRSSVCREKAQVGLTRAKWDHQDDVKACKADESCIKMANERRDARASAAQRQLAECDRPGSK